MYISNLNFSLFSYYLSWFTQVFSTKTIRSIGSATAKSGTWAARAERCCAPTCSASTITRTGRCTRRAPAFARRRLTWSAWVSSTKSTARRAPSSSHSANAHAPSTTASRRPASATSATSTSSRTTSARARFCKLRSHNSVYVITVRVGTLLYSDARSFDTLASFV